MASILIIDDEDKYFELCRRHLVEHRLLGPARDAQDALRLLASAEPAIDLVLLDVNFDVDESSLLPLDKDEIFASRGREGGLAHLRQTQGLRILDALRHAQPELPVVLMTAREDLPNDDDARRLVDESFTYFLDDEYLDARALRAQVAGILDRRERETEREPFYWGQSAAMARLRRRVATLARGQLPVMILGPTGTGKSLLAREYIHRRSGRSGSFVAIDLSTIPADLMGSHLFGVVRGAYTGAVVSRDGMLAKAHRGTLFLDEIGNLSLDLQKSLLTVLQDRRYRPIGGTDEREVDLKLVVASNEDLESLVAAGRFREDLYMRLNPTTRITLPSLNERTDDFSGLLHFFLARVCGEGYNAELLHQYAKAHALALSSDFLGKIKVASSLPEAATNDLTFVLQPSSQRLLETTQWSGNFRQFEMALSNLVALTLVELVENPFAPDECDTSRSRRQRPLVIPIPPRIVLELVRPWEKKERAFETPSVASQILVAPVEKEEAPTAKDVTQLSVTIEAGDSLNAVSCAVERQYLAELYRRMHGDLSRMAHVLLGDATLGRKVQLRMNQLGMRLRELRDRV
jgi:DNA-binding NtrC family response regulator